MTLNIEMAALLRELLNQHPPVLQIPTVAAILKEEVPTIRARIRRGAFPITVRQEPGGRQYVLLADLVRFSIDGEVQLQPKVRQIRLPRNPLGINGKRQRGRPTNADKSLKKQQVGEVL